MYITCTTLPTGRTYHIPDIGDFSSITTILGKTAYQPWLDKWRERVGIEEATKISKYATDRGEYIHGLVEKYWNNENIESDLEIDKYLDSSNMTKNLIRATESGITKLYKQEIIVWHPELEVAGRVDIVGEWRGELSIIDLKTSKKKKAISQIKDYFIQVCFYAESYNFLFNTNINKLVILITVENEEKVQAFYGDRRNYLPELKYRINKFKEQ